MKKAKLKSLAIVISATLFLTLITGRDNISTSAPSVGAEASLFNSLDVDTHVGKRDLSTRYLMPLGTVFGIKLYSDGAIVTGLQDILTEDGFRCPAKDAGIKIGDYIIAVNGRKITDNLEFKAALAEDNRGIVEIKLRRNEDEITVFLEPVNDNGGKKCGMWIRDSAAGIGTLTFCDPETGYFGGLGHGICDMDTKAIIDLKEGCPSEITLSAVEKGKVKEPGRLFGYFTDPDSSMGRITANDETGIFGYLDSIPQGNIMAVAEKSEVKPGKAEIISSVNNDGPTSYSIKIDEICSEGSDSKNFLITVTDKELNNKTGGIVQGMSGSPIVQNGKLVGAVTHVLVNDPTRGYGIFIENMLEAAK